MWIPRTKEILTCGFQEQGKSTKHVDSSIRGINQTCGFQEQRKIEQVDSKSRGNSNLWVPRAGGILNCGFQEQGEF
jgi:hypothetical protein